ncbi:MAG: PTS sugar transporter subunit IIA [Gemmatimonadaceae bacterium]
MSSAGLALVAGHGDYATGLVSAAAEIIGEISAFVTMSNRNLGADEIERLMRELVDSRGVHVIFTDLPAGSCTIAARRVVRDHPDVTLVTGANLAALLHFASHDAGTAYEAASSAAERAKASVLVVGTPDGN